MTFPGLSRPMRANERHGVPAAPARPRLSVAAPVGGEHQPTPLGKAHQQIEDALTAFEDRLSPILGGEQSGAITAEGRSQMVHDAAAPALDLIDQAQARAADLASTADSDYRQARCGLSPRPNTTLDALNHDAYWRRTSRELDAVPAERVAAECQRSIADATPDELRSLATELGPYLRSRSAPDDWVDTALQQAHPPLQAAADRRRLTRQGADIIASNARAARRALQSAASGSYKRPRLLDPSPKYDPDAQAELVGGQRGPTTCDGHRP